LTTTCLLELARIERHLGQRGACDEVDLDRGWQEAAEQAVELHHHLVDVGHLGDQGLPAPEHEQLSSQLAGAALGVTDQLQIRALDLAERALRELLGAHANDRQQIVEVVRHATRE
jgi:hypothetical protein